MDHCTIKGKDAKNFIHMTGVIRRVQLLLFKAGIIITTWWREEGEWKYIHCKMYKIYITPGDSKYVLSKIKDED